VLSCIDRLLLTGRTALVVGTSPSGMGGATAIALAEAGARVVAVDVEESVAIETAAEITRRGGTAVGLFADAMNTDSVRNAVATAVVEFGPIRCLVNVVGGTRPETWRRSEDLTDDVLQETLAFNLGAMNRCSREVARHMMKTGTTGSIVNFGSISAVTSAPYHAAYGAAKAGVISLTRSMAIEWGARGIRVNAVLPGTVATGHTGRMTPLNWNDSSRPPLGRFTEKEEVAGAVVFLLSDLAGAITGQTINVDAGTTARNQVGNADLFEPRIWPPSVGVD
jgi:NAD(P)-dependent dehydrogenase (short-subunit alcohol dehydrogenase family)